MAGIAAGKVMMTDYHDGAFGRSAGFHRDSFQPNVSTPIAFFNLGLLSSRLSDPLAFGRTDLVISSLEFSFLSIFLATQMGVCMVFLTRKLGSAEKSSRLRQKAKQMQSLALSFPTSTDGANSDAA